MISAATPGVAQVTVDLHALQALPEHQAGPPMPHAAPAVRRAPAASAPAASTTPAPSTATARPAPPAAATAPEQSAAAAPTPSAPAPAAPLPAMPQAAPNTAMINPIMPSPPPTGSPPPPPPVSDKAATTAAPTTSGLRLTFAPGQSELSPDSVTAIKQLTQSVPSSEATINVQAYAPGTPDDPSTARRLSLSRAMAIRSALVADGVPSARIFVRALGAQYGDGPADRADLSVESSGNQAAQK